MKINLTIEFNLEEIEQLILARLVNIVTHIPGRFTLVRPVHSFSPWVATFVPDPLKSPSLKEISNLVVESSVINHLAEILDRKEDEDATS